MVPTLDADGGRRRCGGGGRGDGGGGDGRRGAALDVGQVEDVADAETRRFAVGRRGARGQPHLGGHSERLHRKKKKPQSRIRIRSRN